MSQEERVPVAASNLGSLKKHVGEVIGVFGYDIDDVVIVRTHTGDEQLWVRPDFKDYRPAWKSAFGNVPDKFEVDHIYAKKRAQQYGYKYVRLALVHKSVNGSHGGGIEKLMLKIPPLTEQTGDKTLPDIRYADYFQELKLDHVKLRPSKKYAEERFSGKAKTGRPGRKLSCTITHTSVRNGQKTISQGSKSVDWHGDALGLVMNLLVWATNKKGEGDALEKLKPQIELQTPESGGLLVALVYQQPGNADSYGFSTELFLTAYILGPGNSPQEAHDNYQAQVSRTGVISQASWKNWVKSERYIWFSAH